MKTLRASASRLMADVSVGKNQYGGDVTVLVTLDRTKDEALAEALQPLQALLRERAFTLLDRAVNEERIQARVAERVSSQRKQIETTAKANAEATMNTKLQQLERDLAAARRDAERSKAENARLQQSLSAKSNDQEQQ